MGNEQLRQHIKESIGLLEAVAVRIKSIAAFLDMSITPFVVGSEGWISVEKQLPKAGQQVFMIDAETGYAYVGWMNKSKEWWFYTINQEEDHPEKTITHWKPIIRPGK